MKITNKAFDVIKWYEEHKEIPIENIEYIFTPSKTNNKEILKISNLSKSYGVRKQKVLDDINLDIRENENIAILGPNGAGKTTLVEIIAGINKPDSGSIDYLFDWKKTPMEKIGIQFQGSSYPNGIKVRKIINFYIAVFDCAFNEEEIAILIKIFGIDEFINKNANSLSGGQLQRINALLSIIHKPKIIFLDEISTGLDISSSFRIKKFIKDFCLHNGTTIVLVSHDLSEIKYIAQKVVILLKGKIVASIYLSEIIEKYKSLENFLSKYFI
ncbi:MAG: ABC transporter ATP-binding protein [Mycoplasmoidaceae bacterium]